MKLRIVRIVKRYDSYYILERRRFLTGWEYVSSSLRTSLEEVEDFADKYVINPPIEIGDRVIRTWKA